MTNIIYIFLAIILLKFFLNLYRFAQCKSYFRQYKAHVKNPDFNFEERKLQTVKLFQEAGIEDSVLTVIKPTVMGIEKYSNVSVFGNLSNTREDVVGTALKMFHQALGVYRSRTVEAFNPLYWLEVVIYLPQRVLKYLGVSTESVVVKIAQVIYWVIAGLGSLVFGLVEEEVLNSLKEWLLALLQ